MGIQTIPDCGEFYMANDKSAPQKNGGQKGRWWRKGTITDYKSLERHIQTILHVELLWVLM